MIKDLKNGIPKIFYSKRRKTFAGEDFTEKERLAIGIMIFILLFPIIVSFIIYYLDKI